MAYTTSSTLAMNTQRLPGTDEELAGPPRAIAPVRRAERISSIDAVRGVALLGILMVNIDDFAGPAFLHDIPVGPALTGPQAHLNLIVLLLKWAFIELSIVGKSFLCIHAAGTLFICKRSAGPRIDAPCLGASSGRVNLPQTPCSIRRLFAATRVGLMLEALALTTADCEAAPALP
jgi:hypothetical protein